MISRKGIINYPLSIVNFLKGCEVPETMVNLPYIGTLADMSEAALFSIDNGQLTMDNEIQ